MPTDDTKKVIKNSVTSANYNDGVLQFLLPGSGYDTRLQLPSELPAYWSRDRDSILGSTPQFDSMWASAVSIACTKMAAMSWEVDGPITLRVKRAQDLLHLVDLQSGWTAFLSKHLQSYLLNDNGAFIEVVRATTSMNSPVIGLVHLDSTKCQRTGDPEIPVIYLDRLGRYHELRQHEVIEITDMPDPRDLFFGVGHCAASRAYRQIIKQVSIETYIHEKVTGRKIKEVNFVSGINQKQVENFVKAAQGQAEASGLIAYMGAVIVPVPGDKPPEVATVALAEFPDGFNRKEEFDIAVLAYADAIGLDPQDLQPLTGQSLGSGAQSQILSDKAAGKGLTAWRQAFMHAINLWVLPDMTTMAFIEHDWRDKKLQADFNAATVGYVKVAIESQTITAPQGLQVLVDENVLPKEFLPEDTTPGENLADDEKLEVAPPVEAPPVAAVEPPVAPPPVQPPVVKGVVEDLLKETHEDALKLAKRILRELGKEDDDTIGAAVGGESEEELNA